jgi:hypothetical protein
LGYGNLGSREEENGSRLFSNYDTKQETEERYTNRENMEKAEDRKERERKLVEE